MCHKFVFPRLSETWVHSPVQYILRDEDMEFIARQEIPLAFKA